jgi:hypothetical protein
MLDVRRAILDGYTKVHWTSYGEVIGVKIENLVVNAPSAAVAFVHAVVEPLKALCSGGRVSRLVILLDALDEAAQHLG